MSKLQMKRILPKGTAYITDLGMTGPADSILGMEKEAIIEKSFSLNDGARFEVASGAAQIQEVVLEIDNETLKVKSIQRISKVNA